ncbi:MAG: division/cell wall cluster transcriptional repressor MraZ [Pseudomonadota bacterium]
MVGSSGIRWVRVDPGTTDRERNWQMFLGAYEHMLDDKGRVSLPVRFRDTLSTHGDSRLVLTTNVDPGACCLVAYPVGEWQVFQEKVAGLPQFDESVILLRRLHIAGAAECLADRQGRILIPQILREYAGLSGAVVFAGLGNSIEIWDRERWTKERDRAKESLPQISEALARFGL